MSNTEQFWLDLWEKNQIRWHQETVNPQLVSVMSQRLPNRQQTIFVPLCGKTLDMTWLAGRGHRVIGVELSELAVKRFFEDNAIEYERVDDNSTLCYRSNDITIVVGDFFNLKANLLRDVTFVYDRAALVALDESTRADYASTLRRILPSGFRLLLLTIEYSGSMVGPPFSVSSPEILQLFPEPLEVTTLVETELALPGSRFAALGVTSMIERVSWISATASSSEP